MKTLIAALVIGPLVLSGPSRALTTFSSPPTDPTNLIKPADTLVTTADHKIYMETKEAEMAQWRRKIDDFGAQTETQATRAGQAAALEVEGAWARVEQAASKLDTIGEAGWEGAKADYARAGVDLEETWAKFHRPKK